MEGESNPKNLIASSAGFPCLDLTVDLHVHTESLGTRLGNIYLASQLINAAGHKTMVCVCVCVQGYVLSSEAMC